MASVGGPVATRTLLSARFRRSRRSSSAWSLMLRLMRDGERPRAPDCGSGHARRSPPRRRALRFGCSRTRTARHGGGLRACRRGENISAKRRTLALWRVSSQSSASGWASGRRLNRSHVPNGVRCSELALHSVLAHSPQPTNARCARGEEPKARSFDCGASSRWIDWVQAIRVPQNYQRQAYAASECETRNPPTAPRVPRVVRGGVREDRRGGGRGARRTRTPHRRGVSRGSPSRST